MLKRAINPFSPLPKLCYFIFSDNKLLNINIIMTIFQYLEKINKQFQTGNAREHSYRAALQNYLEALLPKITITNEPARSKVGSPDFILADANNIPIAYIETKDIGKNLDSKDYKEQFDRYKKGLDLLIITDYLEFRLYKKGDLTQTIKIATLQNNKIVLNNDALLTHNELVRQFEDMIQSLQDRTGIHISIKSANDLALRMAAKARLFADVIFRALAINDQAFEIADGSLSNQFKSFQQILIGDISHKEFSDIYAQTVTYGMFAARLHDDNLDTFSRREAADLIPKSNPFLRKLFQYIASHDLDERVRWIVDDLAEVFRFTDVRTLLQDFGKATQQNDPIIHFYETFLAAYDASLRKARGVWYTPEPVVNFIVRAVDEILKTEFRLKDGLADTSKVAVEVKTDNFNKRKKDYESTTKQIHKVQLLDPACGTGTFLAQTIKHIHKKFRNQAGIWNSYVNEHLIPRLHGFELLMASYAMAHIKMDLLLRETGYTLKQQNRFKIFLTNALEAHHKDAQTLFWGQWLADEARQADEVKRDTPVMVVLGNPPYSGHSVNNSDWIQKLLEDYKQEPEGGKLQEKNPKWLNDDYVKFIRFGQYFVDKNKEGVLAFINNHSFLDNPTFRGMRWHLLTSFDKIYVIDLHGNAKKKETQANGEADQNVFDIQQGVSINLFIKTGKKKNPNDLAEVYHFDLYGNRSEKYNFLNDNKLETIDFNKLNFTPPQYFFVQKDFDVQKEYDKGFSVQELFPINSVGIVTARDHFTIHQTPKQVENTIKKFMSLDDETARTHFNLGADVNDWQIKLAKKDLQTGGLDFANKIVPINYRPFDTRFTYFTGKSKGFICRSRGEVMQHFLKGDNIALTICRQVKTGDYYSHVHITNNIFESCIVSNRTSEIGYGFVLYLYPNNDDLFDNKMRTPNLNMEIVSELGKVIGKRFTPEKARDKNTFSPIDILDYIYAILHTPQYRSRYKEFLKIDFPRVPYPKNAAQWQTLVQKGGILRGGHLLESDLLEELMTSYPQDGDNVVSKPRYENGKVWLNATQYFEGITESVWQFYIGGYQPAQKWLKDRAGRALSFEDIMHYQKMITALSLTEKVMGELTNIWTD